MKALVAFWIIILSLMCIVITVKVKELDNTVVKLTAQQASLSKDVSDLDLKVGYIEHRLGIKMKSKASAIKEKP